MSNVRFWTRSAIALSLAVGGIGVTGTSAQAAAKTPAKVLRAGVQKIQRDYKLPGVIGMVRNGDKVTYAHAGKGDMFRNVPADPRAQFRIGSNTKQFTSAVLLQLEAEHKLSLNDKVGKWLPGVVGKNGNDGRKITIRQLLNHTSRIPDYLRNTAIQAEYVADLNPGKKWDPRKLVDTATANKPLEKYAYSNTNYVLAGMIIKAVTGKSAAAQIRARFIKPLHLTHTTFPVTDYKLHGNWLHGYTAIRDISFSSVQLTGSAGAMVSTAADLAKFERALFSGRLLPKKQQRELETVGGYTNYALGVGRIKTRCGTVFTHNGAVLGYESTWLSSPDGKRQVVLAQNEYHLIDTGTAAAQWKTAVATYCAGK